MPFLRHAPRHVHASLVNWVTDGLTSLGWLTAGQVPFGGAPIRITETQPFVGDQLDNEIEAGMVCITLGNEVNPDMEEMGGPLASQEYPFFLDVFMATEAEAVALATDIRDLLLGRVEGYGRFVQLVNQVDNTPVAGWTLELNDVERVRPQHAFPVHWNAVHATITAQFSEVVW